MISRFADWQRADIRTGILFFESIPVLFKFYFEIIV